MRRSVYAPVFRNALPEIFEAFDFADPSSVVGKRNASTVAPQALFVLNHPFPRQQVFRIVGPEGGREDDRVGVSEIRGVVTDGDPRTTSAELVEVGAVRPIRTGSRADVALQVSG